MSDSLSLSAGPRAAERTEVTYSVLMRPIDAKGKVLDSEKQYMREEKGCYFLTLRNKSFFVFESL